MTNVGERIKKRRVQLEWTQDTLAEKTDLAKTSIVNYENNLRSPKISDLEKIAQALSTTVAYLVGEVDIPEQSSNELDELLKEVELIDPSIRSQFRGTKDKWSDFSPEEQQAIVFGLKYILGRADADQGKRLREMEGI